jgi:hypothetical protein
MSWDMTEQHFDIFSISKTLNMKKLLTLAIFILSGNAYTQNNQSSLNIKNPTLRLVENVQGMLNDVGLPSTSMDSQMYGGINIHFKNTGQESVKQVYDSIYHWSWDTLSSEWVWNRRYINNIYDANYNMTSFIGQQWIGGEWVTQFRTKYTFDANNNETSYLSQTWNGNAWKNYDRSFDTYDVNNNNTSHLVQNWDGKAWVNYDQHFFTYDANSNYTGYLDQFWSDGAWKNSMRSTVNYDTHNNQTYSIIERWEGGEWVIAFKNNYTYDANNNRTHYLYQYWDGSAWKDLNQENYTYDANNNQTGMLSQFMADGAWMNSQQYIYTYDTKNNRIGFLFQTWVDSAWVNLEQYFNTYNANNKLVNTIHKAWANGNINNSSISDITYDASNFVLSESYKFFNADNKIDGGLNITYYFHTVVADTNDVGIFIYPNPARGMFTLSSDGKINVIEIFNLSGARVYYDSNFASQTLKEIDLSTYAKGIYFIKTYNGSKSYTGKVVIQ